MQDVHPAYIVYNNICEQALNQWNNEITHYRKLLIQKGNARHLSVFDLWVKKTTHIKQFSTYVTLSDYFRRNGLLGMSANWSQSKDAAPAELLEEFDRIIRDANEMLTAIKFARSQLPTDWSDVMAFLGGTAAIILFLIWI